MRDLMQVSSKSLREQNARQAERKAKHAGRTAPRGCYALRLGLWQEPHGKRDARAFHNLPQ